MDMTNIYLLLGTNLGNKLKNLERVAELLIANRIAIRRESSIYETAAWGIENQPSFLNQVLVIETSKSPEKLLELINKIEVEMGRVRTEKWGERLIDVDLLYYGAQIIETEKLTVPHPEIQNRRFTLLPLAEITPDGIHPVLKKSQLTLLNECQDALGVEKFEFV